MTCYSNRSGSDLMSAASHFEYNPDTGELKRKDRKNGNGSIDRYGYLVLKVKGIQWKAHRIAWAIYYGEPPAGNIDHIDRDKTNNKIKNLRVVSQKENVRNTKRRKNSSTGVVGVYKDKSTKGLKAVYTTRVNGKTFRFRNLSDAVNLRRVNGYDV